MGLPRISSLKRNPLYPPDALERRWALRSCKAKAAIMQIEDVYLNVHSDSSFKVQEVRLYDHRRKGILLDLYLLMA